MDKVTSGLQMFGGVTFWLFWRTATGGDRRLTLGTKPSHVHLLH
jgi:hypothetical protein